MKKLSVEEGKKNVKRGNGESARNTNDGSVKEDGPNGKNINVMNAIDPRPEQYTKARKQDDLIRQDRHPLNRKTQVPTGTSLQGC